jgi:mannose-6-phosphate isomerase-like protein (cupin superfamily)
LRVPSFRCSILADDKEAPMAGYTIKTLTDVPDVLGDYPGEMRMLTGDLGAEQVALTFRRMPQHTGGKGSYGHRHTTQEEIYFVVGGKLEFKLDDEIVVAERGTAIRVAPEVVRSVWNAEPDDAELVIVSVRLEDQSSETDYVPDFWPED